MDRMRTECQSRNLAEPSSKGAGRGTSGSKKRISLTTLCPRIHENSKEGRLCQSLQINNVSLE